MSNDNKSDIKSRLAGLKELTKSDPHTINTDDLYIDSSMLPASANENIKYIDYTDEKTKHKEFAEQLINNIIETYVDKKLLDTARLKDLKQTHILDYSKLLLMSNIAENNLIQLQELIDTGDLSKEAFDSVNKASKELRDCMNSTEKLLEKCEKYWSEYSVKYGLENKEEKIVQENMVKTDSEEEKIVISMSALSQQISTILEQQKKDEV